MPRAWWRAAGARGKPTKVEAQLRVGAHPRIKSGAGSVRECSGASISVETFAHGVRPYAARFCRASVIVATPSRMIAMPAISTGPTCSPASNTPNSTATGGFT